MDNDKNEAARRMVDEGLVASMAEARRYTAAGVTPERLKELRSNKSQPLRSRRDYGAKQAGTNLDPTAYVDRIGWDFEVRLPNNKVMKAGSSDDAYALLMRYAKKIGQKVKVVDIQRGLTREINAQGNIQEGRQAMEVSRTLDKLADRLEAHGMRETAERLDVISNTIEATNWGASPYEGRPWGNEPWGNDPTKAMKNFHKALDMLGWQGGTIHQVARELGVRLEEIQEADDIESLVNEKLKEKAKLNEKGDPSKESATMVGDPYIVQQLRREGFDVTRYPGDEETRKGITQGNKDYGVHVTYNWRVGAPADKVFDVRGVEQEDVILNIVGPGEKGQEYSGHGNDIDIQKYEVLESYPVENRGSKVEVRILFDTDKEQELILKLKRMLKPEGSLKMAAAKYMDPSADEIEYGV